MGIQKFSLLAWSCHIIWFRVGIQPSACPFPASHLPPPPFPPSRLVNELVEGVLPVGARLPEVDLPALVGQHLAVDAHALAVALHADLLDVRGELLQRLAVRQDGLREDRREEDWRGGGRGGKERGMGRKSRAAQQSTW